MTDTTPEASALSFTLDGETIAYTAGQSILDAAHAAGKYVPHLCYHPELSPHGSCRLCVVNVNGKMAAACTTPAQRGVKVENNTDQLQRMRRSLTQLLFIEGNHHCPSCEMSGQCQLQAMAYHLDMHDNHFEHLYPQRQIDASHPEIFIDRDRCINCALCVRASHEMDQKDVFGLAGRGIQSQLIMHSESGLLADTALQSTDKAAHICPVGAILPRTGHYQQKPEQRLYDQYRIDQIGNQRADNFSPGDQS